MKLIETRFVYTVPYKSCEFSFGYSGRRGGRLSRSGNEMGKRKLQLICEGNYAPGWLYFKRNAYQSWLLWQCRVVIVETKRIKDWLENVKQSKAKQNKQNADSQSFNMQSALLSRSREREGREGERGGVMTAVAVKQLLLAGWLALLLFCSCWRDAT